MNSADTRRHRLRELIDSQFQGRQAEFLRASGESQSEISGILGGRKSFGEKKARKIEVALNLPEGWLDAEPRDENAVSGSSSAIPQAVAIVAALSSVSEAQLEAAIHVLEKVLQAKRAAAQQSERENLEDDVVSVRVGRPRPSAGRKHG